MYELYEKQGLIVEPSSATAVAILQKHIDFPEPACVILTGRNISDEDFATLVGGN
jgi:threonine synthase